MRKKADPRTPKHPEPSRAGANNNGLIVKEQSDSPRSDRETCALDDRSHGTPELSGAGPARQPVNRTKT
jgi:hypothetical protein